MIYERCRKNHFVRIVEERLFLRFHFRSRQLLNPISSSKTPLQYIETARKLLLKLGDSHELDHLRVQVLLESLQGDESEIYH